MDSETQAMECFISTANGVIFVRQDNLVGPGTDSAPQCSVVRLTLESGVLTSSRGGYVDLSLTVNNSPGCTPAYNLHADILAEQAGQWVGETYVDFDVLCGGRSAGVNVDVPVTGFPDGAFCTLSWDDEAGNRYSAISDVNLNVGLLLATPAKE